MACLPVEVITHILTFVNVSDRKEAALVNRKWHQASLDRILQMDMQVALDESTICSYRLQNSGCSRCPHLTLQSLELCTNTRDYLLRFNAFMLHSLTLYRCSVLPSVFVDLLSKCFNLRSLTLKHCKGLLMCGRLLQDDNDAQRLRSSLVNLQVLRLVSLRQLTDATFHRIMSVCQNITELSLANSQFDCTASLSKPASPSKFTFKMILECVVRQATVLKSLDFSGTRIEDNSLQMLANVEGLRLQRMLLFSCRNITDVGLTHFCRKQLDVTDLNVSQCSELSAVALHTICTHLPTIRHIGFAGYHRGIVRAVDLLRISSLSSVDLSECTFNCLNGGKNADVRMLIMKSVTLRSASGINNLVVELMCTSLKMLTHLDLSSCFDIGDCGIQSIAYHMKMLTTLKLAWCKLITDAGLLGYSTASGKVDVDGEHASVSDILGLRCLDISACTNLTDASISKCIKFNGLQSLNLTMCREISDNSLRALATNSPALEILRLSKCRQLTDHGLRYITQKLLRLRELDISSCGEITDKTLHAFMLTSSRLRHLDVSFCSGITPRAVDQLEQERPFLTVQRRLIG